LVFMCSLQVGCVLNATNTTHVAGATPEEYCIKSNNVTIETPLRPPGPAIFTKSAQCSIPHGIPAKQQGMMRPRSAARLGRSRKQRQRLPPLVCVPTE
jgi:hypothetical protein